jgi:hypothetical protein
VRETGAGAPLGCVRGEGDASRPEHPERGISTRHPEQAHRHREVERPFDRELDPFMHWGTSAGDSTVWVHERKDVQMALSKSAQAVLDQLALLPYSP